jgi:hypothetical protein
MIRAFSAKPTSKAGIYIYMYIYIYIYISCCRGEGKSISNIILGPSISPATYKLVGSLLLGGWKTRYGVTYANYSSNAELFLSFRKARFQARYRYTLFLNLFHPHFCLIWIFFVYCKKIYKWSLLGSFNILLPLKITIVFEELTTISLVFFPFYSNVHCFLFDFFTILFLFCIVLFYFYF